jgi:hypothetical protein
MPKVRDFLANVLGGYSGLKGLSYSKLQEIAEFEIGKIWYDQKYTDQFLVYMSGGTGNVSQAYLNINSLLGGECLGFAKNSLVH